MNQSQDEKRKDPLDADGKSTQLKSRYNSPFKLILILSVSIFFCELLVMFFLPVLPFIEHRYSWTDAFLDAVLLVIFLFPILYFFILNPLVHHISSRQAAEKNLKTHLLYLEKIVEQRTQNFQTVNNDLNKTILKQKKTESLLRQSEEKFKRIFDNLQDGYLWADKNGNILLANKFAANILGYDLPELMQKNMAQDIYFASEDRETVKKIMAKNGAIENYELTFQKKDGEKIIVEANSHLVYDDNQQASMEGTFRDITSRKLAEEEKTSLEAQLRQSAKIEAVGTLAGGIAHDFNNILGIIIGNTELAVYDIPDWNPARQNLSEIKTASLRARDVVRQLLSFSRKAEQEKRPSEISTIVKESVQLLRASIPSSVEINSNISTKLSPIMADPTQIHQVVINLCTNAAHAMEENGGILGIRLKQITLDEEFSSRFFHAGPGVYIELTVSDTGCGIDPMVADRIFDPYFTTKEPDKGTGIGLSVVHGIVKNHNGVITVDSEVNKRTTIKVMFPAIAEEPVEEKKMGEELLMGNENVLFVDDETALIKIGERILERLGYKVQTSTSPVEALELFCSNPDMFDLVITDMTMPRMTGSTLAIEILKIRPELPIILCTGYSDRMSRESAKSIGIRKYIEKPLKKSELSKTIRDILDQK